jgi:hypothetical protein
MTVTLTQPTVSHKKFVTLSQNVVECKPMPHVALHPLQRRALVRQPPVAAVLIHIFKSLVTEETETQGRADI